MLGVVRPVFARLKSAVLTPVTLSLNVTVHWTLAAFVGLVPSVIDETVGAVPSHVTVLSVEVETLLVLPAGSVTPPAGIEAITVPAVVMPDTARLKVLLSALGFVI